MNQEKQSTNYKWTILGTLFFSQVILSIGAYAWGPLGPYLKESLSLNSVQIGSFVSILYLASVIFSIPSGMSVDRWGVKINLFICMMLMGGAMTFASFANGYLFLITLIALSGVSYSMMNPLASKGLNLWFDKSLRATAFGIRQMGVTLGGAIAGVLLIYLAQMKNWNLAVLSVGLLSTGIGIIGLFFYKNPPDGPENVSIRGKELSEKTSIMDLVKNRNLLLTCLVMTLLCLGQSSISAFMVLYLKEYLNFPVILAGSLLTVTMISGGVGRVFWGMVSDRLFKGQRLPVMKIVCAVATVSSLAAFFWTPRLSPFLFILVAVCWGLSYLGFQGVTTVLLVEASGPELAGRATGFGVSIAWIGLALGPVIYGMLVSYGYPCAWLFVAITSFAAILLCQAIHETDVADSR